MASEVEMDELTGLDCDLILQLLEEDFFENAAEIQSDFEQAAEEVNILFLFGYFQSCNFKTAT